MDETRVARLTEQQRACLRFVHAHMTSKEIAPRLGIEPGSVDQYIKTAMRVLGVADRRAAAKMLADHEQRSAAQRLVYQPGNLAFPPDPATFEPPVERGRQLQDRVPGATLREEQAPFRIVLPGGAPTLPFPTGAARPSDFNWVARLAWIAAIAIGVALAFGGLVSGVEALVRLTRG